MAQVGSHSPFGKLGKSLSLGTFLMQMASVPAVWLTAAPLAHAACGIVSPGTFTAPVTCIGTGSDGMTLNDSSVTASGGGTTNNHAVRAERAGGGSIFLNASNVTVVNNNTADNSVGIYSLVDSGAASATLNLAGTNRVTTAHGTGVITNVRGSGSGASTIGGQLFVDSRATGTFDNDGVEVTTQGGGAATLTMTATGEINVSGGSGILIDARTTAGGIVMGTIGPGMTVNLDNRTAGALGGQQRNSGIYAYTRGTGTVSLDTAANVNTIGAKADAIRTTPEVGAITVGSIDIVNSGALSTSGDNSTGIFATSPGGTVSITSSGPISTSGKESNGIQATSTGTQAASVNTSGTIATTGQYSVGVYAVGNTTQVTNGGNISGGWQSDKTSTGPTGGLPAAGVVLGSRGDGSTLTNNGSIGALSDRAVFETGTAEPLTIINNGTVTGFVQLGAGDSTFTNLTPNSFDMRNFADTNGDGIRDTKRVSISDFGGGTDTFDNSANGVVRLAPVANAATTDPTGYYVPTTGIDSRPLEASFYDFTREGLLQGQMVNLETFDNAGTIDLRGAALGNTLVITANPSAGGAAGAGFYVSDGGQLLLNTRLNDGIPLGGQTNSYSDMLIVDQTQLGVGGATTIGITIDPASAGALTTGNGIEVVEVRNKAGSADGAFVLGGHAASGAYEYTLYRNGVGSDSADGNWYLRSELPPDPPIPPGPGPTPPPEPIPDYRNEVPADIVLPALANRLGLGMLGTYRDRLGVDYPDPVKPAEPIWCKDPTQNFRCTPTPAQSSIYTDSVQRYPYAVWGRVFGESGDVGFGSSTRAGAVRSLAANGPSYDFDMYGLQVGANLLRRDNEDGTRDVAGFYVGAGRITSDVDTPFGQAAGSADIDGYSLGGYWTRIGESGWYLDGVVQATGYDASTRSEGRGRAPGESFGTDGWGLAASIEAGKPFALGQGWLIEPQAQLVYQHVSLDDNADHFGQFDYGNTDALYGRLGARLDRDWMTENGRRMSAWASADIWSAFGASGDTTVSSLSGANPVAFHTDLGGNWGHVGLGLSGEVARNVTVFASGDYNFGVGKGDFESWGGRVGLKVKW